MSLEQDRDLVEIDKLRKGVRNYFLISMPGFIYAIKLLTVDGVGDKIAEGIRTQTPIPEVFPLVIALAMWLYPFEVSERRMEMLKIRLRGMIRRTGRNPVRYTAVERIVNLGRKPLWDKSSLPPESWF